MQQSSYEEKVEEVGHELIRIATKHRGRMIDDHDFRRLVAMTILDLREMNK